MLELINKYFLTLFWVWITYIFWDALLHHIKYKLDFLKLKRKFIFRKRTLIMIIKFEIIFNKIIDKLRPYKITSFTGIFPPSIIFKFLTRNIFINIIKIFKVFLFSKFSFLVLLIFIILNFWTEIITLSKQSIINIINQIIYILDKNYKDINVLLIVILIFIVLNRKNKYKNIIARFNDDCFYNAIKTHKKLISIIASIFYAGCKNLSNINNIHLDSIVNYAFIKKFPDLGMYINKIIRDKKLYYSYKIDRIDYLDDIPEIDKLYTLIEDLEKRYELYLFSSDLYNMNKNIFNISHFIRFNTKNNLNSFLFTKTGIVKFVEEKNIHLLGYEISKFDFEIDEEIEKEILKKMSDLKRDLEDMFIKGIELLVNMNYYLDAMHKVLLSDENKIQKIISNLKRL